MCNSAMHNASAQSYKCGLNFTVKCDLIQSKVGDVTKVIEIGYGNQLNNTSKLETTYT